MAVPAQGSLTGARMGAIVRPMGRFVLREQCASRKVVLFAGLVGAVYAPILASLAAQQMVGAELYFQRYAFLRDIWPLLQEYLPAEFDGTAAL